jgi:Short C-terminal domain
MAGDQEQAAPAQPESAPAPAPTPAPPPAAPPAPGGLSEAAMAELKQLGELHDSGVLTDEEFAAQKAKILGG